MELGRAARDGPRGVDIALRGASKAYVTPVGVRVHAMRDIDLDIAGGQLIALTGPSGSGKSTMLHVLGAMDCVDSGRLEVGGQDVTAMRPRELVAYRRRVGMVFQRFHLIASLTALDNILAPVIPYRTSFDKDRRATELLERVGLGDRWDALPSRLSGGQQQRVAIARALVNDPVLLLADEPTGNLDSATSAEILDLLVEVNQERGVTMVLATHDHAVATRCDQQVSILDGRVIDEPTLTHHPRHQRSDSL